MPHHDKLGRRNFLTTSGIAIAAAGATGPILGQQKDQESEDANATPVGRLNQSVCKWCFPKIDLETMAQESQKLGLVGIDLLEPKDFETVKKYGLVCTMVSSHALANGLCDPKFHDDCLEKMNSAIEATSNEGWRNVICFSGNARGIDRETGMKNCVDALKKIVGVAEEKKVVLNMELLNSRVNHADYMCDNTEWGIELVKRVGSDNFRLLYDIYHMQIMEGDLIRSIENNHEYFGHYHTAGNPGRNELDADQEINYVPIAKTIADTGFDGYFAHEFIPKRDPMQSLREAVELCVV